MKIKKSIIILSLILSSYSLHGMILEEQQIKRYQDNLASLTPKLRKLVEDYASWPREEKVKLHFGMILHLRKEGYIKIRGELADKNWKNTFSLNKKNILILESIEPNENQRYLFLDSMLYLWVQAGGIQASAQYNIRKLSGKNK